MSYRRPVFRRASLFAAGAAVAALTLSACGDGGTQGGSGNTNFVTGKNGIASLDKSERVAAPKLEGKSLDGKPLSLDDYQGKIVVLNVWGSWCGPCRVETPYLVKVAKELKPKGVEFVGINTRDFNKGPAVKFEEEHGVEYPSFYDPSGKLILQFPKGSLAPQQIPSTIVIDRDGKLAARALQAVNDKQLHQMIDPLLAEK
ncbi:TlpA disulfide reductase family protein [Streptomyces sp. B-S-A8]|uniref:TlpA disulfide reductase family protein n=1 Tax=Streptomyces solicavernae TaxID=3043614 RepID=A0ABT6RN75_9ACTN|nr:TlpA disulfide reductase family protein [Streptomyces sp. B-S-A8]MDI3385881.1 TlpA disulfide reductase family protein [Streptomyces sp. B-S-A8]